MQWTWVRALVWEDLTCHRATKLVRHNYWACALGPVGLTYWAHVPQLLKPACLEPVLGNKRSHRNEKPAHRNEEKPPLATTKARAQQQRPIAAKNKINLLKKRKLHFTRYHYALIRMAKLQNMENTKYWWRYRATGRLLNCCWNAKWYKHFVNFLWS